MESSQLWNAPDLQIYLGKRYDRACTFADDRKHKYANEQMMGKSCAEIAGNLRIHRAIEPSLTAV